VILAAGWLLFCVLHSVLAASSLKTKVEKDRPKFFTYYRLFYTLFAAITFGAIVIYQALLPSPLLISRTVGTNLAGLLITAAGALTMIICIKKYFLSLSGLKSLVANKVVSNTLRIDGIHRYVRHPLYAGTFLFIWGLLLVYPVTSLLVSNIIITVYTLYGMVLEEKKLVEEFGADYVRYQASVPALIPFKKA
jgi:protein-S-isoprenylcysteine O-methyltransferase Ste14